MFRAPVYILLLGVLGFVAPAQGQLVSKPAAVILVARVPESFALVPALMPAEEAAPAPPEASPQGVHVVLNWRLRPGRTFQIGYELEDSERGESGALSAGMLTPSRILDSPPIFSFLPSVPKRPNPIVAWGNRETDPAGVGGFLLALPAPEEAQTRTLRLRAIIL